MKKQFSLSVQTPCPEKWDNFTPTSNGGFCGTCSKNVVDFTKMNEKEIIDYFKNKPTGVCGRFYPRQLTTYSTYETTPTKPFGIKWVSACLASLSLVLMGRQGFPQEQLNTKTQIVQPQGMENEGHTINLDKPTTAIRGKVVDESGEPIAGVNIIIKGTNIGTVTDIEGMFSLSNELKTGDVLIFSYIGYMQEEYTFVDVKEYIDIQMTMDDIQLMGDVAVDECPYTTKPTGLKGLFVKIKDLF